MPFRVFGSRALHGWRPYGSAGAGSARRGRRVSFGFTHTFPVRDILDLFGISISRTATGVVFAQFVVTVAFCAG
jgi:hypothetical protein